MRGISCHQFQIVYTKNLFNISSIYSQFFSAHVEKIKMCRSFIMMIQINYRLILKLTQKTPNRDFSYIFFTLNQLFTSLALYSYNTCMEKYSVSYYYTVGVTIISHLQKSFNLLYIIYKQCGCNTLYTKLEWNITSLEFSNGHMPAIHFFYQQMLFVRLLIFVSRGWNPQSFPLFPSFLTIHPIISPTPAIHTVGDIPISKFKAPWWPYYITYLLVQCSGNTISTIRTNFTWDKKI